MSKIIGISNIAKFIGVSRFKFFNNLFGSEVLDAYTKLLLHGDGVDGSTIFTDSSLSPKIVTPYGDARISTTQSKFGGSSMYFDGSSYVSIPDSSDFDFGTGDFSIDFWSYQLNNTSYQTYVSKDTGSGSADSRSWVIQYNYTYNAICFAIPGGHVVLIDGSSTILGDWYHIYFGRNGNIMYKGLNGTVTSEAWVESIPTSPTNVEVGRQGNFINCFNGYIDELRISKGIARWTTNFTPPNSPYGG